MRRPQIKVMSQRRENREDRNAATSPVGGGTGRRGRGAGTSPAQLAGQARPPRRAVRPGRSGRRLCPPDRPGADRGAGPPVRDRQPAGCRRGGRHRHRRQGRTRRLHAADDVQHPHHQRDAAGQPALCADARPRGGGAGQFVGSGDRGEPRTQGPDAAGLHRAGQGRAGQARLCLLGPGHALSHGRRAVQSHERHRHPARAAQEQRRGAQRRDRWPRPDDDRRGDGDEGPYRVWPGPRTGHHG